MTRGKGNEYVNFDFKTPTVAVVWHDLQKTVLNHRRFGRLARRATIIARTGSRGWNNYKLLHHFDPSVPLDTH